MYKSTCTQTGTTKCSVGNVFLLWYCTFFLPGNMNSVHFANAANTWQSFVHQWAHVDIRYRRDGRPHYLGYVCMSILSQCSAAWRSWSTPSSFSSSSATNKRSSGVVTTTSTVENVTDFLGTDTKVSVSWDTLLRASNIERNKKTMRVHIVIFYPKLCSFDSTVCFLIITRVLCAWCTCHSIFSCSSRQERRTAFCLWKWQRRDNNKISWQFNTSGWDVVTSFTSTYCELGYISTLPSTLHVFELGCCCAHNAPSHVAAADLYYFMVSPTLCYELSFPRSARLRKRFLFKRLAELVSGAATSASIEIASITLHFCAVHVGTCMYMAWRTCMCLGVHQRADGGAHSAVGAAARQERLGAAQPDGSAHDSRTNIETSSE